MKNMRKRLPALALCAALALTWLPAPAWAAEDAKEESAPALTVEEESAPAPVPEADSAPAPAPETDSTPAPAPEADSAPVPTVEEDSAPVPTVEEESAPAPTPYDQAVAAFQALADGEGLDNDALTGLLTAALDAYAALDTAEQETFADEHGDLLALAAELQGRLSGEPDAPELLEGEARYNTNLVVNGDASQNMYYWGTWTCIGQDGTDKGKPAAKSAAGEVDPTGSGYTLPIFMGGSSEYQVTNANQNASSMWQDINLTEFNASSGKAKYALSAVIGGYADQVDYAVMEVQFKDSSDARLGDVIILNSGHAYGAMTNYPASGTIPAGAVKVNIEVKFYKQNREGNNDCDGYVDNISFKVTENKCITLTYLANGGTGGPGTETVNYNQAHTLSTIKPTRRGYTFSGWFNATTGGTVITSDTPKFNTTYSASWTPNKYNYTFGSTTKQYTFNGTSLSITAPALPANSGNTFYTGWKYTGGGDGGSIDVGTIFQPGETVNLTNFTGNLNFEAQSTTVSGTPSTSETLTIGRIPAASIPDTPTQYTYTVTVTGYDALAALKIGGATVTRASSADNFVLTATDGGAKTVTVDGANVGTVKPNEPLTLNYKTLTVTVNKDKAVTLQGGPSLVRTESGSTYTYTDTKLGGSGSYPILVDGEATGKNASYGSTTALTYHTATANITVQSGGAVNSVELVSGGKALPMRPSGSGYTYTYTGLSGSANYTLRVNGETVGGQTTNFGSDKTLSTTVYAKTVTTKLNGAAADVPGVGTVAISGMYAARTGVGTYLVTKVEAALANNVTVNGKPVTLANNAVNYYTVTYNANGGTGAPTDGSVYLSGASATVLGPGSMTRAGYTFLGWKNGSADAGETVAVNRKVTLTAQWIANAACEAKWQTPGGEEHYGTLDEALEAAENTPDVTITVQNDATATGPATIPETATLIVPEGKTVDVSGGVENKGTIENSGTITGGTLTNTGELDNDGTLSATVTNTGTIDNGGGTVSGTVTNTGTVEGGTVTGTVSGGTVSGPLTDQGTITGATVTGQVTLPPGGEITDSTVNGTVDNQGGTLSGNKDGTGSVAAPGGAGTGSDPAQKVVDALGGAAVIENGVVKLVADVDLTDNPLIISGDVTIDLNGHTITGPAGKPAVQVTGGSVTIEDSSDPDSGSIEGGSGAEGGPGGAGIEVSGAGSVTVGGGTVTGGSGGAGGNGGSGIANTGTGSVSIQGGGVAGGDGGLGEPSGAGGSGVDNSGGGAVSVTGGQVEGGSGGNGSLGGNGVTNTGSGPVDVSGGEVAGGTGGRAGEGEGDGGNGGQGVVNSGGGTVNIEDGADVTTGESGVNGEGNPTPRKVAAPTIAPIPDQTYTGEEITPAVTLYDGRDVIPEGEYDVTYARNVNAGTATITIKDKADKTEAKYAITEREFTFKILKAVYDGHKSAFDTVMADGETGATVTLPAIPAGASYGTPTTGDSAFISNAGTVSDGVLTYHTKAVDADRMGKITVPVTEGTNHQAYNITVDVKATIVEVVLSGVTVQDKVYDGQAVTPDMTHVKVIHKNGKPTDVTEHFKREALTYTYYQDSIAPEKELPAAPSAAGTYWLSLKLLDKEHSGAQEAFSFTISPKPITVTANAQTITYGESIATDPSRVAVNALADGDTLTGVTLDPSATSVPGGTITPSAAVIQRGGADVTASYDITYQTGALTVNKATLTPSVDTVEGKVYDGSTATTGTLALAGIQFGEEPKAQGVFHFVDKDAAENKAVNVTGVALTGNWGDNYELSADTLSNQPTGAAITPKPVSLIWAGDTGLVYSGAPVNVTATAGELVEGDTCAVTVEGGQETNAGNYTATATALSDPNYQLPTEVTRQYTISPKPVTPLWHNMIQVYNGTDRAPVVVTALEAANGESAVTLQGVVAEDDGTADLEITVTQDGGSAQAINAGTYTVSGAMRDGCNYVVAGNDAAELTVQKAPVTFAVTHNTLKEGDPRHGATITPSPAGVPFTAVYKNQEGEAVDPQTQDLKAGTYPIWVSIHDDNYHHVNGATGEATQVGVFTVYTNNPPPKYAVTFDADDPEDEPGADGGVIGTLAGTMAPLDAAEAGALRVLPQCDFTCTGYVFAGWKLGSQVYPAGAAYTQQQREVTFTAQWVKAVHTVEGVVDQDGNPVTDVQVTLMLGSHVVAQRHTDAQGKFRFENIAPGLYNLVTSKDGVTMTVEAAIVDQDEVRNITVPTHKTNSVVVVTPGTPNVVVGNLENNFTPEDKALAAKEDVSTEVEYKFTVQQEPEDENNADHQAIRKAAGSTTPALYLELTLEKTVTEGDTVTTDTMSESSVLIKSVVPLPPELQGKRSYSVIRVHVEGGETKVETLTAGGSGERIEVNNDKTALTIYAKKFSSYAIAYSDQVNDGPGKPAIQQPENGTVSVFPAEPQRGNRVTVTITPEEGYEVDEITVTKKDGTPVEVTRNPDGTYTFTQPKDKVTISASFKKAASYATCPKDNTCPIWPFTDASATAWYHDGVHYCIENGLMNGYGNGKFGPNDTLTRAMLARILYNKEGWPAAGGTNPFEDVKEGAWYSNAVLWANQNGVAYGYGNGKFGPEDPITREQLALMLWRYAGSPEAADSVTLDRFPDGGDAHSWAVQALRWAVEKGIVTGKGDGALDPTGTATRAEAATMIQRFFTNHKSV